MRLISQIPSGSPMIVIIASQAIVETIPVSHQPMKMNHSARTSSPGPSWTSAGATGDGGGPVRGGAAGGGADGGCDGVGGSEGNGSVNDGPLSTAIGWLSPLNPVVQFRSCALTVPPCMSRAVPRRTGSQ